jgi:hypothetical protein
VRQEISLLIINEILFKGSKEEESESDRDKWEWDAQHEPHRFIFFLFLIAYFCKYFPHT